MKPTGIQEILNKYRVEHRNEGCMLLTDAALLEMIFEKEPNLLKGIPQSEIDEIMKGKSVFGTGFNYLNNMGLEVEHTAGKKTTPNKKRLPDLPPPDFMSPEYIPEMPVHVADKTYVYNRYKFKEELQPEYKEPDPVQEALITMFFISNQDVLQDAMKYLIGREITGKHNFKNLEEVAEYLLKKQGKECSEDNINKLAKELIILNSNGYETDFDVMVNNALENINKGNVRYIDRNSDITKVGALTTGLKRLGIEPTEENMYIYQAMHIFEKDLIDGTCFEIEKNIRTIFYDYHDGKIKGIDNLYIKLSDELSKYHGSPLAEKMLGYIINLHRNKVKDINQWNNVTGLLGDYLTQQGEVQDLFFQCYHHKKISLSKLKETMLTKYGINMYAQEEQRKAQEIQLQYSMVNLLSNIYSSRSAAFQDAYDNNGLFYDLYNTLTESADVIANALGRDIYTNKEYIDALKDSAEFWEECTPDKMTYAQFQQVFKKIFGKDFNVEAVKDLLEYCASHPDLNVLSDVHREFLDKFEAVFGMDFLKQLMNDNAKLNTDKIASGLGNIALMIFAMKYIAGSALIEGVSFNASTFYRALGLSGKGLQLATGMTVGGATFAATTFATQSFDNIIMQRDFDEWLKLPGQVGESFAFGAFASAVHVLLISPMADPQVGKGLKAVGELVDNAGGKVSGEAFERAFLEGSAPVIQNEAGQFFYKLGVNTTAFTAYCIGEDLLQNGTEPLKNGNAGKYIGDVALANLQNILTFEGLQMLIGGSIAGKTGSDSARKMSTEDILQYFETLRNFTIEKSVLAPDLNYHQGQINGAESAWFHVDSQTGKSLVTLSDGSVVEYVSAGGTGSSNTGKLNLQEVYIFNFPNGRIAVPTLEDAAAFTAAIMAWEVQCKNAMVNMNVENIQAQTTRLQSGSPRLNMVNPLSDAPEAPPAETGLTTRPEAPVAPIAPQPQTPPSVPEVRVPLMPAEPGVSKGTPKTSPYEIPKYDPFSAQHQFQKTEAQPKKGPKTIYKEKVKVVIQDLKTMGADGKIIETINDLAENGEANNLPALVETLTDLAEQGKQTPAKPGQTQSTPLLILNGIFNCPPEVIPAKIKAYMYAKVHHFDDGIMLQLVDKIKSGDNDVQSIAVEEIKTAIRNATDLDTLRKLRECIKDMPLDVKALYVQKERTLRENLRYGKKVVVDMASDGNTNALIARYNELADKRDSQGLSREEDHELLGLTLELQELGYKWGRNHRLDFEYDYDSEDIPHLGMTKTELRNKLSAMGVSASVIEGIEYNVNRINLDLFNAIQDPEIIEEYGASLWIDFEEDGSNIPAKTEVAKLLEHTTMIPAKGKGLLISRASKDNLEALKQQLNKIEEDLKYIKSCGFDESVIDYYSGIMLEDNMTFSRELFDVIKYDDYFVMSDVCFNIAPEDIAPKIEIYNSLKIAPISTELKNTIIRKCTKGNIDKIRLMTSLRKNIVYNELELMYSNLDNWSIEQLNLLEQNYGLLTFYDPRAVIELKPEDRAAKKEVLALLDGFKVNKELIISRVNNKNVDKVKMQLEYLKQIYTNKALSYHAKINLYHLVINLNSDLEVLKPLIDAIKDDNNFLEKTTNDVLDVLKCKTKEEAQRKAEIYNLVKDLSNPNTIAYYMSIVNEDNLETLKASIPKDMPVLLKFEAARAISSPQFTEAELEEKNRKLEEIENILAQKAPNKLNEYLGLFNECYTMEAFNARYTIFKRLEAEDILNRYWLLNNVIIQEQADIINDLGLNFREIGDYSGNTFAKKYQFYRDIDIDFKALQSGRDGDAFVGMFDNINTPEEFQRLKKLWTDPLLVKLADIDILTLVQDPKKFSIYEQFINSTDEEVYEWEGLAIFHAIANGDITEVKSVKEMLALTELAKAKDILAEYRAGKEKGFKEPQSKEEIYNRLKVTFPNINIKNIENVSISDMNFLEEYISRYQELTFEQIENAINNCEVAGLSKRANIIAKFPADTAFYLAFCSQAEFDKIVSVLEKRPEILTKPYDKFTFLKLVSLSDSEWEALKVPVEERTNPGFNPQQYRKEVQELLNSDFSLDLDTWHGVERQRTLLTRNHTGRPTSKGVVSFDDTPLVHANRPVLQLPSVNELMLQLERTGSFTLEIGDVKGMAPIQVKDDKAVVKPNEPKGVQKTDISVDIGKTRIWDNHRLARDLLQNFCDGNGYTMEGVTITVEKQGDKYAVKISGKGIFDYDRILDLGGGSKGGESREYVYGPASGDSRSAGHHGEGSDVIAGNLLCTRGSGYVRYASGDWVMNLGVSEANRFGIRAITKEVHEAPERLEGTTFEFETDDLDLVRCILEAKDYFNGPHNADWMTPDIENEYFAIKFLPKGEKGNIYVVQRFEVEGVEGFDGTLDGMTLIFKRQPYDEGLKNHTFKQPYKLEVGRNRVGLTKNDIEEMVRRYAITLDDESLAKIIGNMEESFVYNSNSPNQYIAQQFILAAYDKDIKIDFGHDRYVAVSSDMNARYMKSHGKIPVINIMSCIGVPTAAEYYKANAYDMVPKMDLTETQIKKLKLLSEAIRIFSSHLDLENSDVISEGNVRKPVYITENIVKPDKNATGEVLAESITDFNGYYGGFWVKESYLNEGDFFDLLATWLHETSHKVDGDGKTPFNERLMKLQKLIVEISNADPSFGQQLQILSDEFDKLSGETVRDVTVTPEQMNEIEHSISLLLREAVEEAPAITEENGIPVVSSEQNTNIFRRLYKKAHRLYKRIYDKIWGTSDETQIPAARPKTASKTEDAPSPVQINKYENPAIAAPLQYLVTTTTPEQNLKLLRQNGVVTIHIPVGETLNPEISDTSIDPEDRPSLGVTENTSITLNYNNAQEWTREIIVRDLFQNFYDGHNGTLDGVSVKIQEVNGKYRIRISGRSEFNYTFLKMINASTKTHDEKSAGGFGEGAKMASKTLLGEGLVDKITFASGDWTMDFTREEGVPRESNPHLARTLHENTERVDGTYVEFETSDKALVEAIIRGKNYFRSSENADFIRISGQGIENDNFGFIVLPEDKKGNLYYIQRYSIKEDGQLEGALNGLSIVFKRQLTYAEKQLYSLSDDPDRKGFTALDIYKVTAAMAGTMTKEQLTQSVEQLERFWTLSDKDIIDVIKGKLEETPEQQFTKAMIEAAGNNGVEIDNANLKMVAVTRNDDGYDIARLQKLGYKVVFDWMKDLGVPSVKEIISKLDNVSGAEMTDVEKQKIALLKDAFGAGLNFEIRLFDAEPNEDKVRGVLDYYGIRTEYVLIDRKTLSKMDFNTLYSQVLIQSNFSKQAEAWGYNMTDMISNQLKLSKDPLYMARFNALAKKFNELK